MRSRTLALVAIGLLAVMFFALNILAGATLRSARIDLTERGLYTLSDVSREIARSPEETIHLDLFYSRSLATGRPAIESYAKRVRELLEEYVRASNGKIQLEVIDPEPFSDQEDEAVAAGLVGLPVGNEGERLYFGLVGRNWVRGQAVVSFFDPSQERFLEYEITALIHALSNLDRPVVGVLSGLPIYGDQQREEWRFLHRLRQIVDIEPLNPTEPDFTEGLDALLVLHPGGLPAPALYEIDQYALAGGGVAVFVDPHCEIAPGPPREEAPLMPEPKSSNLEPLLSAWGARLVPDRVAADLTFARQVTPRFDERPEPVSYVAWLALDDRALNQEEALTGRLSRIHVATSGVLERPDDATTEWTPLMRSSERSMRLDVQRVVGVPDPKYLISAFEPSNERLVIAARLSGSAPTAFPDGPPQGVEGEQDARLTESAEPLRVIVVADADITADAQWLRWDQATQTAQKIAGNGDFIVSAIEALAGGGELIDLRASGGFVRPFELVERLRREAEQQYRARERELQLELQETERRLRRLQQQAPDSPDVILSTEQQEAIQRFREEAIRIRSELRTVRRELRSDIEDLGDTLRVVNIAAMPALVTLGAIGLAGYRAARRRQDRLSAAQT